MSAKENASQKILRNSFWYGLETVLEAVVFLGTSIAIARYLGPEKLGYFSYINFFVNLLTRTSGTGLSTATRKYMTEFIAQDRLASARAVYYLTSRYQLIGAVSITVIGLAGVLLFGAPGFKIMSCILILSITPGVMSWVPAHANSSFEDARKNTTSAVFYIFTYAIVILLTLHFKWDLIGVAAATLVGRTVEVTIRTLSVRKRFRGLPVDVVDRETKLRIRNYCIQSMGIQLVMTVVWDRSELLFLRHFSTLEQMSFYSISFGLANNLLIVPTTFSSATGMTLMVDASRKDPQVGGIIRNASRYLLLASVPVSIGAAAVTNSAIHFAYGARYAPAVPVLAVSAILCAFRAFQNIPQTLLRAKDRQNTMLFWFVITGVVNIALDALLIPHYGAVGAAWGNGLGQAFGVVAIWKASQKFFDFKFPTMVALRVLAASLIMAVVSYEISTRVAGLTGLLTAIGVGAVTYFVMIKFFHALEPSDRIRLAPIGNRLPGPLKGIYLSVLKSLTPEAA